MPSPLWRRVRLIGTGLVVGAVMGAPATALASEYRWTLNANGNWNVAGNWLHVGGSGPIGLGYPNLAGDVATFVGVLTAPRTITIPTGITINVGRLTFNESFAITIARAGTGNLVMTDTTATANITAFGTADHVLTTPVTLNDSLSVSVTSPDGFVIFNGGLLQSSGTRTVTKTGPGGMRSGAAVNNTYTGTTTVQEGELYLQHTALTTALAGPLVIGGLSTTPNAASVFVVNPHQIADTSSVDVQADGRFSLLGVSDGVTHLSVTNGSVQLETGADLIVSTFAMTGGGISAATFDARLILMSNGVITSSATETASIVGDGLLVLAGTTTHTLAIGDGPSAVDLLFSAALVGAATETLAIQGAGVMRYNGTLNNTFNGLTQVQEGRLELQRVGAIAINGPLTVGDGVLGLGGVGAAEVRLLTSENIASASAVSVLQDGTLNLNDFTESIDAITVNDGTVLTGAGTMGVLNVFTLGMTGGSVMTGTAGSRVVLQSFPAVTATSSTTATAVIGGGGTVSLAGANRRFDVANGPQAIDLRIDAGIVGTGSEGINKSGPGTLLLTGNNPFSGQTSLVGGTLLINGTQPNSFILGAAADVILGGTGSVGDVSMSMGSLAPGLSPGVLTTKTAGIGGGFGLSIELNGTTPGSGHDQLVVNGAVNMGGSSLNVSVGFTPPTAHPFLIISNDGTEPVNGEFAGLAEGATISAGGYEFRITYVGGDGNDVVLTKLDPTTYFLAEGATGTFFDDDVLIANPNTAPAPVTLTFLLEGGTTVVEHRTVPAQSRLTVHVDQIPMLEATSASVQVSSDNSLPLVVERTMFWDETYYGGHTANAVSQPGTRWIFAEGFQGFFDTYILIANANATATTATLTFLREGEPPFVTDVPVSAFSRETVYAGDYPEVVNRAFGVVVEAPTPVIAERAMYFASSPRFWGGGHVNTGTTAPSLSWFHAEGATGGFFNTFILLSNPQPLDAHVQLQFLLDNGDVIVRDKTIGANQRLTVNPAAEGDPRLEGASLSTVVTSDVPIVSERSMYWPGDATPFGEGHNSAGVISTGTKWGLGEGRVGSARAYDTYILLANPGGAQAEVRITYLRESGPPLVKTYSVPATSRYNVDVKTVVPELQDESFGALIEVTNGVPIAVERSLYWNANGIFWAGGTNALATRLP